MKIIEEMWKHTNKSIFRNSRIDHVEVFTMVVWSWVIYKIVVVSFSYSDWCLDPLVCMKSIRKACTLPIEGIRSWLVCPLYDFDQEALWQVRPISNVLFG